MSRVLRVLILAVAMVAASGLHAPARGDSALDFVLLNKTGYGIKEVYVAPTTSDDWGSNLLKEPLENNESLKIHFSPKATAKKWDIMIVWVDGGDSVYWRGYALADISKITLKYDRETGETTAVEE